MDYSLQMEEMAIVVYIHNSKDKIYKVLNKGINGGGLMEVVR
jgi:hypothetical protein